MQVKYISDTRRFKHWFIVNANWPVTKIIALQFFFDRELYSLSGKTHSISNVNCWYEVIERV